MHVYKILPFSDELKVQERQKRLKISECTSVGLNLHENAVDLFNYFIFLFATNPS
jgi:hypothetical protein